MADAPPVRAVIFDLDGTMLDTDTSLKSAVVQILADYGKADGWDPNSYTGWGKQSVDALADLIHQTGLPLTPAELAAVLEPRLREAWQAAPIMPGIRRLVAHLKASGIRLAIVSSSSRQMFRLKHGACAMKHALFDGLECVICADDVVEGKPSPEGFLKAAAALAVPPAECLAFEDSLNGVQSAVAAGMRCVAIPSLHRAEEQYAALGAHEVLPTALDFRPDRYGLPPFTDLVAGTVPRQPPLRVVGEVVRGFGRGSKDLGIPTANLSSERLPDLLCAAANGIYVGWASVGNDPAVYKMVMSIGWNPTFNDVKVKSVEPHLLHKFDRDFYGAALRLVICGYVRPELRYTTLEALIDAINNDIRVADTSLELEPYAAFRGDPFLRPPSPGPADPIAGGPAAADPTPAAAAAAPVPPTTA
jgi:HAD superfamily hydrolase (TIGR01509 family)